MYCPSLQFPQRSFFFFSETNVVKEFASAVDGDAVFIHVQSWECPKPTTSQRIWNGKKELKTRRTHLFQNKTHLVLDLWWFSLYVNNAWQFFFTIWVLSIIDFIVQKLGLLLFQTWKLTLYDHWLLLVWCGCFPGAPKITHSPSTALCSGIHPDCTEGCKPSLSGLGRMSFHFFILHCFL